MNNDEGRIGFEFCIDDSQMRKDIKRSQDAFKELGDTTVREGERMDNAFSGVARSIASLGAAWSLQEFGRKVAEVRGEFQQLEVAMETMLQSKTKADALMAQMVRTAATTPFGLQDVAGGAKQLLAYGLEAEKVNETLIRLGNIASGLSLPLGDLIYLYGTTMAQGRLYTQDFNQFTGRGIPMIKELAAQFGVAENKVKELVEQGKVGFPEVQKVIESLTNEGGMFFNLMEKQSKTITGRISNIEDAFSMMLNEIGQNSEGIINGALSGVSYLVEHYQTVGTAIMTLVADYGIYKATLMAVSAYTNAVYSMEATQLKELLVVKTGEMDADLAGAVAKGRMSSSRAAEVQALRVELAAKIENARAEAILAAEEERAAVRKRMMAKLAYDKARAEVEAKQEEIFAMEGLGAEQTVETLYKEKDILVTKMHAAQEKLDAASKVANTASTNAQTKAQTVNTLTTQRDNIAKKSNATTTTLLTLVTGGLTKAFNTLKAAMLSNPFGIIAVAITTVIGAMMTLSDTTSETSEEVNRFGDSTVKQLRNVDTLFAVINSTSAKSKVHQNAVNELCKIYEEYGFQIDGERDKLEQLNELHKEFTETIKQEGEERQRANALASYEEALNEETQNMREALLEAYKNAEWDGSGIFDDWDADEYQEKAKQLATIVSGIIESEGEELSRLSGEAYERKLQDINARIKQAYQDMGLDITKTFTAADGSPIQLGVDVDAVGITENYLENIKGIIVGRDRLNETYQKGKDAAQDENDAVNVETMSFEELFKTAQKAKDKVAEVNNTSAKPTIYTNSIDNAITQTDTLISNLAQLGGYGVFGATGFKLNPLQSPNLWGGSNYGGVSTFGFSTNNGIYSSNTTTEQISAQQELDKRFAEAIKTRKGTADLLKEVNSSLETAIVGSSEEKELLSMQKRLQAQQKKFRDASSTAVKKSKKNTDAEREAKERIRLQEKMDKLLSDIQKSNAKDSISFEQDAHTRKMKEIEFNFNNEKDNIQKQAEEFAELNKKLKKKTNANGLTDEQQAVIDEATENANKKRTKEEAEVLADQAKAMRDYLTEYGSLMQQKLAITQEYEERIKQASSEGERLALAKERDKSIETAEINDMLASVDWYTAFGDMSGVFEEQLRPILDSLNKFVKTDKFGSLDAANQNAIVTAMNNIRSTIGDSGDLGWQDLRDSMMQFQAATQALTEAQDKEREISEKLAEANKKLIAAKASGDEAAITSATAEVENITTQLATASATVVDATKSVNTAGTNLGMTAKAVMTPMSELTTFLQSSGIPQMGELFAAFDKLKGGIDALKAMKDLSDGAKDIADGTKEAADAASDIGDKVTDSLAEGLSKAGIIGQIVSAILKILDILKEGIGTIISTLIDSILGAIEGILDNILSGKFIEQIAMSIIRGIGGIIDTVVGHIGSFLSFGLLSSGGPSAWFKNSNAEEVEATIERLTDRNELLQTAIEDLTKEIQRGKGMQSVEAYQEAVKYQEEANQNYLDIARAQAGYHNAHHSWNYYMKWNQDEKDWISKNVFGGEREFNGTEDLWSMTPEQIEKLRSNVAIWEHMKGAADDYGNRVTDRLNEYIEQADKLKDLESQLYEGLTGISFDSMYDSFIDSLMDMNASAKEIAGNISETFMKAMLSNKVGELMSKDLEEWYENFGKAMQNDGTLDEEEMKKLREQWEQYVEKGVALRDDLAKATGYDAQQATSQDSTKKGFATASQDSIDELNGRFTGIQISTNNIDEKVSALSIDTSVTRQDVAIIKQHTEEMRNLSLNALDHLENISKNTHELYQINERLGKIEKNTRNA